MDAEVNPPNCASNKIYLLRSEGHQPGRGEIADCRQSTRQFTYCGDRPRQSTPARERKENAGRSECSCRRRAFRIV